MTGRKSPLSAGEGIRGEAKKYMDQEHKGRFTVDTARWENLKPLGRSMRHEPTKAEQVLWQRLRNRQCDGLKFRRQHAVSGFIVDFVCLAEQLIVEVDGEIHEKVDQRIYDQMRSGKLSEAGFSIIRFTNDRVLNEIETVIAEILMHCKKV